MYEVTLVVTDSKSNSDEQEVTVKVTNVEEPGTIELSPLQPRVGFPVTATLTDPDNVTAGSVSWQWYRGNNIVTTSLPAECAETTDNNCAIKDAAADTYTPVADDIDDILTAVATYTDGSPNDGDAKDVMTGEAANAVLADTRNKAPVFPDQDMEMEGRQTAQERMIAENTASGTAIGDSVTATDSITANDGTKEPEQLTYSLGGPDAASFSINRADGQLSTKAALDKEVKDTYTVTVTATDPSGETDTATVTIKVMNEDEPPMIMVGGLAISGMSRVEYPENDTMPVATYTASGPDADMASWTLEGDDAGDSRISSAGVAHLQDYPRLRESRGRRRGQHLHGHPRRDRNGHQRGRGGNGKPVLKAAGGWHRADRQRGRPRRHGNRRNLAVGQLRHLGRHLYQHQRGHVGKLHPGGS